MNENVCFYFGSWCHVIPWGYFGAGVFSLHNVLSALIRWGRHETNVAMKTKIGLTVLSAMMWATMNCQTRRHGLFQPYFDWVSQYVC